MGKRFQRRKEDFVCENCGEEVIGSGYTDHCPKCLFGKHVDNFPGDRENPCGGILKPVDVEVRSDGQMITFLCLKCGEIKKNKVADSDDPEALAAIARDRAEEFWKK